MNKLAEIHDKTMKNINNPLRIEHHTRTKLKSNGKYHAEPINHVNITQTFRNDIHNMKKHNI